jgi:hypothetical protein
MTFTGVQLSGMESREFAEHAHKSLGVSEITPWGRSPDAIGGAYGVAWYEVFEDERGKRYKVFCTDGERGGRGPYRIEEDFDEHGARR